MRTLPEIVQDLERRALEAEQIGATAPVAGVYRLVILELQGLASNGTAAAVDAPSTLLTAQEAARALGVTVEWLYRRSKRLPFTRHLDKRTTRYDPQGLAAWAARRTPC